METTQIKSIFITEKDYQRLLNMVQAQRSANGVRSIEALGKELERAHVVASTEIPPDVITMNSTVRIKEIISSTEMEITIVYPKEANLNKQKISVLAPVGTAVLGCRVGDEIEWPVQGSTRTYKIEEIIYQPEAAGDPYL